jgi:hypothetical protein
MANILATRRHTVLQARADQLATNLLAYYGGAPYIHARLSRFPSESDVDFFGSTETLPPSIGRKERAFLINFAKRIAHKINQYVFATPVIRAGADEKFLLDATTTGMSLNQFMAEVSSMLTVQRWCWIGVDRPQSPGPRSIAQRERSGDRVYWKLYTASEVVDWSVDARGGLAWLLTEDTEQSNADPRAEAVETKIRYLWQPGSVTRMVLKDGSDEFQETLETRIGGSRVPFVLAGLVSAKPWWFDDLERVQRAVLDLLSSRDTQIFKAVFALLVVSKSFSETLHLEGIKDAQARRKIGLGNPLIESAEESGLTRYLNVPAEVFAVIREAVQDLQVQLMDIVGLGMSVPESRQVQSAEAKQWDHLDPEAVLRERAALLEEVETKAADLSAEIGGPVWTPYTPIYAKAFDISDFESDMRAATSVSGLTLPPKAEKLVVKAAVRAVAKRFSVSESDLAAALAEVDTYEAPGMGLSVPG